MEISQSERNRERLQNNGETDNLKTNNIPCLFSKQLNNNKKDRQQRTTHINWHYLQNHYYKRGSLSDLQGDVVYRKSKSR